MSKPTLGDLNVRIDLDVSGLTPEARWMKESSHLIPARPLTPAEFDSIARERGYVSLDGARRIKLCSQSGERMWGNKCAHPDDDPCEPMYVWFIRELADGVLAAIDQEAT